ncbi:DUF58 domain-containing protein [Methylotenera versatilis]|uniref:DUF58 domain-containing protein n=1 Tax=Methylotenera versatilis (strain 301) TaxID=666681 RepID=D7DLC6_METV0|nr:DUF58 domain-containing protein [Methylotenera versatilis]ADI30597.1 conserved hypothetical protein [Methylotenera versatilis 301]
MIPAYAKPFYYQIPWKSSSIHFGEHRGTQRGLGFEFKGNVPLIDYPDARRVDLRQTLRDPYEQVQVKLFNQDNTTPIFAVCDVSSSMQFKGQGRKLDLAKEIAASIAYSAFDKSDVFSFIAYNNHVIEDLTLSLSHHVHQSFEVIEQLGEYKKMRVGSEGILEVPEYLSQNRGLVFWISDFHMPIPMIEQALNAMSAHQVIPIVLWDDHEYKKLPKFGFGNMIDPETGLNRTIFFREAIRAQFEEVFAARKQALEALFTRFDSQAIYISGKYDPDVMSHYFEQMMA